MAGIMTLTGHNQMLALYSNHKLKQTVLKRPANLKIIHLSYFSFSNPGCKSNE